MPHYKWNEIGFLSCIMWKNLMQPTLFLKVKDLLEFNLFYIVFLYPTLCFLRKNSLLFPQSKHSGAYPTPATSPGFCHKPCFLQETVWSATEKIQLFPTLSRKSLLTPLPCHCLGSKQARTCLFWPQDEPSSWCHTMALWSQVSLSKRLFFGGLSQGTALQPVLPGWQQWGSVLLGYHTTKSNTPEKQHVWA